MISFFLCPSGLFFSPNKRIVNIMKMYIKRNNLQLKLIRYVNNVDFLFTFARQIVQCTNIFIGSASLFASSITVISER